MGRSGDTRPLNAFELINAALDISSLFERRSDVVKRHTRFTSREAPERIAEVLEAAHRQLGGRSERNSFKCALGLWVPSLQITFGFRIMFCRPRQKRLGFKTPCWVLGACMSHDEPCKIYAELCVTERAFYRALGPRDCSEEPAICIMCDLWALDYHLHWSAQALAK